jgi:nucleolin
LLEHLPSILRDDDEASSSDVDDFGEALEQEMEALTETPMEEVPQTGGETAWEAPALPSILSDFATNESSSSDSDSESDSSSSSSSSSSDSDSDSAPENNKP